MTTVAPHDVTCFLCGLSAQQQVLMSTNEQGSPDLDLRPPPMKRATMDTWVYVCPECHYARVATINQHEETWLIEEAQALLALVGSAEYRTTLEGTERPQLASAFVCAAMAAERVERLYEAAWCRLYAAWVCDDEGLPDEARELRLRAASLFIAGRDAGQEDVRVQSDPGTGQALIADVLRRAGEFDAARAECDRGLACKPGGTIEIVLAYGLELVTLGDADCHTVEDAVDALQLR